MTVSSQVKQTAAVMKGIEATIRSYSQTAQHPEARDKWERQLPKTSYIISRLEQRIQTLEREEPQYKGF